MFLPLMASAFSGNAEINGIWYLIVTKAKEAKVIKPESGNYSGDIVIPSTIEYDGIICNVVAIQGGFNGNTKLNSVTIPNSITSIPNYAFDGCTGLTSVNIQNSVTSIGVAAFRKCTSLTSFTIPSSVTNIEGSAFSGCSGFTSFTIPGNVTSLGWSVFEGCTGLTSINISENITKIPNNTFQNCTGLKNVTIPNSVTIIETNAFRGCSSLISITIGNGVGSIGTCAFAYCPELTDVYCYSENVPSAANTRPFEGSYIDYATLHVPDASLEKYKKSEPWSGFRYIVGFEEEKTPKCATPTITFVDGKLKFDCETEDVDFVYDIINSDVNKGNAAEVASGGIYKVSVYAAKVGFMNSDMATLEFNLKSNDDVCDVNHDGTVDVADISTIIDKMAGK